jgi:predicted small lipoprotein YifL
MIRQIALLLSLAVSLAGCGQPLNFGPSPPAVEPCHRTAGR